MKKQLAKISLQRLFRHGSRSFSLHIVCSSEVPAANHHRGDSFGGQCRYEPSPNILMTYPDKTSQKVELTSQTG